MSSVPTIPSLFIPLSLIRTGRTVLLRGVQAGQELASRLAAMGLLPGARVHVFRNDRKGPIILGVKGSRVMLGRGMAEKLTVEDCAASTGC